MQPIFAALLKDPERVAELIAADVSVINVRMNEDVFFAEVPHWLYVDDTPLHLAAAALDLDAAQTLITAGASAKAINRRKATPLHYACDPRPQGGGVWSPERQTVLIGLLAGNGAELDALDQDKITPLHRAVRARSPAAVTALIRLGADARAKNRQGSTPLHLAMASTGAGGTANSLEAQLEIVAVLVKAKASFEDKDLSGKTPGDWVHSKPLREALGDLGLLPEAPTTPPETLRLKPT